MIAEVGYGSPAFLSLAERDRRHALVADGMRRDGLDVLILPASANRWEQSMADSRYVSGIGGFGTETLTILTPESPPVVYVFNRAAWWQAQPGNWIADVRDGRNRWARNIAERLAEIGFSAGTIGFSGLAGQTRTPDGVVAQQTFARVRAAFPRARLVDATALVQELRSIKSDEEVDVLRRAAAVTDRMVEAMTATARPGVTERAVYAAMVNAMLLEGAELPSLLIFGSGPGNVPSHGQFVPTDRVLAADDLLVNEIEARIAGYGAQTVAPLWLGTPGDAHRRAAAAASDAFEAVRAELRPGATMGGLMRTYRETVEAAGFTASFPLMHARGLGDEVPAVIDARDLETNGDVTIAAGMVFVVKPRATSADTTVSVQLGDTVLATRDGGRRLGRRPLGLGSTA